MQISSNEFKKNSKQAIADPQLQAALKNLEKGFITKRAKAKLELPEFELLREQAKQIKDHTLTHLDQYLEIFEQQVLRQGGQVHWAVDAKAAQEIIINLCKASDAKLITKSKSMVSEEIDLNKALQQADLNVLETDLGEYIIQLRAEPPSHIVAPAIHLRKQQVAEAFYQHHLQLDPKRSLNSPRELLDEARVLLRKKFLQADVGITGANFLIAESGTVVMATNEGNGDLTQGLVNTHIVVTSIEKLVPTFEDCAVLLRLLARSATGQEITTYTTFTSGAKRDQELDGAVNFHIVLVDNGRSDMLASEFQDMLRCIRCGACLNHCPVYGAVGGKTYGSMYPGPMGAVLTPSLFNLENAHELPNASSFCGRCIEVCPVKIPLTDMMRTYREQEFVRGLATLRSRWALKLWAWFAKRPKLYHKLMVMLVPILIRLIGKKGYIGYLPFISAWTKYREFPAPQGKTFQQQWKTNERTDT